MAAALARARLESLLREKKLDVTLTHVRPPVEGRPGLPFGGAHGDYTALNQTLGGGLPRGELSEITGPRSSGRTTLMCAALAAVTARGELAALIDALDRFDVESGAAAGIALPNLLWVRGLPASVCERSEGRHEGTWRAVERAIKAFTIVLESRACGLAVCDLADVPTPVLRRLPFTTWFRVSRLVEGAGTAALLVAPERLGRSAGGVSLALGEASVARWRGESDRARLLEAIVPRARVVGRS